MIHSKRILLIFALCFTLVTATSCNLFQPKEPTQNPEMIYTSAAQTVAVQLTQRATAHPSPSNTPTASTSPTAITSIPATSVSTATLTITPQVKNTITLSAVLDKVEFLKQTPPDGSSIASKHAFQVIWEIKNVGQTTWTTSYRVRFFSGIRLGDDLPNEYTFTKEVKPGETYQVTVDFLAGVSLGDFQSNWVLTNQKGENFYPLYISIRVALPTETPTPTATTPAPTETTTGTP